MLATPGKKDGGLPLLFEQAEADDMAKSAAKKQRQRSQVGRNAMDTGKLAAIHAHCGRKIGDDVLYGVVREGKNLWQRVSGAVLCQ